jgi:hypothetical protein
MQKVPLRSDSHAKHTAEPPSAKSSSHRRHISRDSIPSLDSPYICRRLLDPHTEQELRLTCALILANFKPSDADFADADPKLDFSGPHKPRSQRHEASQARVHKSTGTTTEHPRGHYAGRHNAPRSATIRTDIDSDDARSLGTPLTASTDAHLNNGSTAPTSVAVTSGRSSKRASHQYETAAAAADAQAADWMRQELEKRRHQQHPQTRPETSHRPPSRASSIKAGLKEYMFPGSASLSRSQSRDSMRTMDSQSSNLPKRSGSSHGWRSWGLQRKSSSRTSSRPGTSGGRAERPEQEKKVELNLNRELPPLPSLDTWVEPEQRKEQRKSRQQGAHIATLMRSQDLQQDYAAAVRQQHRRSGSDSMGLRYTNAHVQVAAQGTLKSTTQVSLAEKRTAPAPTKEASLDFNQMMSAMSSSRNLDDQLAFRPNDSISHVPQRSTSTVSHHGKVSTDGRLHAPNFSRKISTEVPSSSRPTEKDLLLYRNAVQISGRAGKEEQKSKLRRVFSGWMLRKDKKEDWMGAVEKQGIRNGVMVQEEAALPPVVRY